MDFKINLEDYALPKNSFVDATFWEQIDKDTSIPSNPLAKRFYVPSRISKRGWIEKLETVYGIKPWFVFDSKIANLPNEIPFEELEKERLECNKYVVRSMKDQTPLPPPEKVDSIRYLAGKNMELHLQRPKWEDLTDFEKRVLQWRKDYGLLWDHRKASGLLFPMAKPEDMKFEIDRELFFRIPEQSGLVLSLAREINSERPIYGFRREGFLDWPFDIFRDGFEYVDGKRTKLKWSSASPEKISPVVEGVDRLTKFLEKTVNS